MRLSHSCFRALLLLVVVLGWPIQSTAQDLPTGEVSAGWRLLALPDAFGDGESQTLPLGWYVDLSGNLTRALAVVGEVSGSYKSFSERTAEFGVNVDVDVDLSVHTFMGGLRFNARQRPQFTPYAQVLFGLARGSGTIEGQATVAGRTISVDESESANDFAFDVGGGVNVNVSDGLAVRAGASYLRIGGEDGGNGFRFGVGLVFPF